MIKNKELIFMEACKNKFVNLFLHPYYDYYNGKSRRKISVCAQKLLI
jgi:hypothetical protein